MGRAESRFSAQKPRGEEAVLAAIGMTRLGGLARLGAACCAPTREKKRLRRASYLLHARIRALPGGPQMQTLSVKTDRRTQLVDVTAQVQKAVASSGVATGICDLLVPHTTAAITINECADPDDAPDVEGALDRLIPPTSPYPQHQPHSP